MGEAVLRRALRIGDPGLVREVIARPGQETPELRRLLALCVRPGDTAEVAGERLLGDEHHLLAGAVDRAAVAVAEGAVVTLLEALENVAVAADVLGAVRRALPLVGVLIAPVAGLDADQTMAVAADVAQALGRALPAVVVLLAEVALLLAEPLEAVAADVEPALRGATGLVRVAGALVALLVLLDDLVATVAAGLPRRRRRLRGARVVGVVGVVGRPAALIGRRGGRGELLGAGDLRRLCGLDLPPPGAGRHDQADQTDQTDHGACAQTGQREQPRTLLATARASDEHRRGE